MLTDRQIAILRALADQGRELRVSVIHNIAFPNGSRSCAGTRRTVYSLEDQKLVRGRYAYLHSLERSYGITQAGLEALSSRAALRSHLVGHESP